MSTAYQSYKPSPIYSGGLEVPLVLNFSYPYDWILNTLKDFAETFYTYDFTGLVADLDVEALATEEPFNNSTKVSNNRSVSDKTTRRLLKGEKNILIVIDVD